MLEARGSVQLLAGEFGEHVPREISRMIATIPGIGIALQEILPIMGAVWALEKIYAWAEANKKAAQDLTDEQKAAYDAATTGAEKFMKAQEASIKATYELAIAQASGNPIRQDQLRVAEAIALGKAQDNNIATMEREREVLRGIVAEEEKKAQSIRDVAAEQAAYTPTGGAVANTSDEDAKGQKARDTISDLTALIEAASLRGDGIQAKVIDGIAKEGKDRADAAKAAERSAEQTAKALEKQQEASQKYWAKDGENMRKDIAEALQLSEKEVTERERMTNEGRVADDAVADEIRKREKKDHDEKLKLWEEEEAVRKKLAKQAEEVEKKREEAFMRGEEKIARTFNDSFSKTLVEGGNFSKAMTQMGEKMLEEMIQQEMEYIEKKFAFASIEKLTDATVAAAHAMAIVPYPGNFAAAANVFTATLALAGGGEVPGSGWGDTVPAMLTPGETVVTRQLTDQVKNSVGAGRGGDIHVHTSVNAVDAAGFEGLLKKHAALITRHVGREMRRQNR
jgi:hypothetical protein